MSKPDYDLPAAGARGGDKIGDRSWLILDQQLQCCLAPVEAGRTGLANLGRLSTRVELLDGRLEDCFAATATSSSPSSDKRQKRVTKKRSVR